MASKRRARRRRPKSAARRTGTVLSEQWRAWIAENLMRAAPVESIVERLAQEGVPETLARRAIAALRRSPALTVGTQLGLHTRRLEMIVHLQRELRAAAGTLDRIERRDKPSGAEFYARYVATGTPVVMTDALVGWKALGRWSPAYLAKKFGHIEVEVTDGRESDPDYDMHTREHSRIVKMVDFARRVARTGKTNDFYLVANNHAMRRAGMEALLDDVVIDPEYFGTEQAHLAASFWFGPAGTVTPLHHDTTNIVFHQAYGKKRMLLISPFETALLRYARGVYCDVDPEKLGAYPDLSHLRPLEVTLGPGDALFIPVGWWHHVRALETSISISFTNLRVPNQYEWYAPGRVG